MMRRITLCAFGLLVMTLSSFSCSDENEIVAAIQNGEELIEDSSMPFQMVPNSPNPFSFSTDIGYLLRFTMHVRIKVLTEDWQVVQTLVNAKQAEGIYTIRFNAKDLPSGDYYCTMEAEGITQILRMKLIK